MADSGRSGTTRLEQAFVRLEAALARLETARARAAKRGDGEVQALRARCAELAEGARGAEQRLDQAIARIRALIAD